MLRERRSERRDRLLCERGEEQEDVDDTDEDKEHRGGGFDIEKYDGLSVKQTKQNDLESNHVRFFLYLFLDENIVEEL